MDHNERLQEINNQYREVFIPVIVVIAILMVIGLIGNPLVIYFYACRMKPTASYMFIATLACFDLLSSVVSMPLEIMDLMYYYTFESVPACKTLRFINIFASIGSGVTLVSIAIDRYRKICKPFEGQITIGWAKVTILCCFLFSLLSSWPGAILYTVDHTNITDDAAIVATDCRYHAEDSYAIYIVAYNLYFMFLFIVTIIVLTVLYILVGRQLFNLRSFRFYATKRKSSAKARPMSAMTATSDVRSCTTGYSTEADSEDFGFTKNLAKELEIDIENDRPLSPISEEHGRNDRSRPTSANSIAISARSIKSNSVAPAASSVDEQGKDILPPEEFRSPGTFRQTQSFTEKTDTENVNSTPRRANSAVSGRRSIMVQPIREPRDPSLQESPRVTFSKSSNGTSLGNTRDAKGTGNLDTKKLKSQNINTRRYTVIAICISTAFVISFLPYLVLIIWSSLFYDYDPYKMGNSQLAACELFLRSFLFNGAFNPIIYGMFNSEFKDMVIYGLKRCLCCCCSLPQEKPWRREHSSN